MTHNSFFVKSLSIVDVFTINLRLYLFLLSSQDHRVFNLLLVFSRRLAIGKTTKHKKNLVQGKVLYKICVIENTELWSLNRIFTSDP